MFLEAVAESNFSPSVDDEPTLNHIVPLYDGNILDDEEQPFRTLGNSTGSEYSESKIIYSLTTPTQGQTSPAEVQVEVIGDFKLQGATIPAHELQSSLQEELTTDGLLMGYLARYRNLPASHSSKFNLAPRIRKRFINHVKTDARTHVAAYVQVTCPGVDRVVHIEKQDEHGVDFATEGTTHPAEHCRMGLTLMSRDAFLRKWDGPREDWPTVF